MITFADMTSILTLRSAARRLESAADFAASAPLSFARKTSSGR